MIIIKGKPNLITIVGEVKSPGIYTFSPKSKVSAAIREAGGYTPDADLKNIFIKYPHGESRQYGRWFNNHKVRDGSVISVGKKPEEEPFDRTEYLKELTSIVANLLQAYSLILLAMQIDKTYIMYDIVIIGGGIVGLSTCLKRNPLIKIISLKKNLKWVHIKQEIIAE